MKKTFGAIHNNCNFLKISRYSGWCNLINISGNYLPLYAKRCIGHANSIAVHEDWKKIGLDMKRAIKNTAII